MKKTCATLLALLLLCLTGCGGGSSKKVTAYDVPIPDGFVSQDLEGFEFCYMHSDGSNINMNAQPSSGPNELRSVTADLLRAALEATMLSTYGESVTLEDRYFTTDAVCGVPAYQYAFSYDLYGIHLEQLIVAINDGSKVYTITYTDGSGDWMDDFEDSASNIDLTLE